MTSRAEAEEMVRKAQENAEYWLQKYEEAKTPYEIALARKALEQANRQLREAIAIWEKTRN